MTSTTTASRTPASIRSGTAQPTGAVAAAGLALTIAWIHVLDQGGLLALKEPAYLGWGYRSLVVAAVVCAGLLLLGRYRFGWLLAVAVSAGPLIGIVVSRSVGLPHATDDIGNWGEPLGVAAIVVEASLLVIALTALRAGSRTPAGSRISTSTTGTARHRVVVVGSGFGGLFAVKKLARADVDVTLVSRTLHHLFQPLLYQVATGILSEGEIAPATREILRGQSNARVLLGDVLDVDLDARTLTFAGESSSTTLHYDSLVMAAGAGQSYFGNNHFAEFAPGLKTVDDALELRGRIFTAFERAELATAPADVDRALTFVVVGAGPTGVELVGQIAELAHRTLRGEFRSITPASSQIILLDANDRVLPPFHPKLSQDTHDRLETLGVDVRLRTRVTDLDGSGLTVVTPDGSTRRIEAETIVWAAGVEANPLGRLVAARAGAEVDRAGRVLVEPDTSLPGYPEVFVVGDLMSLDKLPGVAQVAIQSGQHAARTIVARVQGTPEPGAFRYKDKGSMAIISRFAAVTQIGRIRMTGFVAWIAWLFVHLIYLIGFKARVTTLMHWAISFIGRGRTQRAVTTQQIVARTVIQRRENKASEHDPAGTTSF